MKIQGFSVCLLFCLLAGLSSCIQPTKQVSFSENKRPVVETALLQPDLDTMVNTIPPVEVKNNSTFQDTDTTVYTFLEEMPYLRECQSEERQKDCSEKMMFEFIYNHLELEQPIHRLLFSFVIEKDGSVSDFQNREGAEHTNIKDIILQMPIWEPGKKDGQPKRFQFHVPMQITVKE